MQIMFGNSLFQMQVLFVFCCSLNKLVGMGHISSCNRASQTNILESMSSSCQLSQPFAGFLSFCVNLHAININNWDKCKLVVPTLLVGGGTTYSNGFLIAASAIPGGYYSAPIFLQFKEFELYWDAVFLRLEEEYWRSPFFNQFYWSDFWSGKWNAWKNLEWFWCWTKWRAERKETGFCSYRCFWESEKLMCAKIFSKRAKFFLFTCGF